MNKEQAAKIILLNIPTGPNRPAALDPVLTDIITKLLEWAIPKCVDWIVNYKKNTPTTNPPNIGLIKMLQLRRQTKLAFKNSGSGVADFRLHGELVVQAILKSYGEASLNQINDLVKNS